MNTDCFFYDEKQKNNPMKNYLNVGINSLLPNMPQRERLAKILILV